MHILSADQSLFFFECSEKGFLCMFRSDLACVPSLVFSANSAFFFLMDLLSIDIFEDEFGEGPGSILKYGGDNLISFHE